MTPEKTEHSSLFRVRAYLEDHFDQPCPLSLLSSVAGLSPFHLVRRFKARFGRTPHQFKLEFRVKVARDLLAQGQAFDPLDLGYADQSHFIRHFNKAWGLSPGQFQKNVLNHHPNLASVGLESQGEG